MGSTPNNLALMWHGDMGKHWQMSPRPLPVHYPLSFPHACAPKVQLLLSMFLPCRAQSQTLATSGRCGLTDRAASVSPVPKELSPLDLL